MATKSQNLIDYVYTVGQTATGGKPLPVSVTVDITTNVKNTLKFVAITAGAAVVLSAVLRYKAQKKGVK